MVGRTAILSASGAVGLLVFSFTSLGQPFQLPTANHALFEKGGEERFFVGTTGKPWTSGTFGCVRSGGWQMHEGLDIRCLQRDKRGEPADSVLATAEGTVVYINKRPSLSNYGNYLILRHQIEGLEIYSLYAHLHEIRSDLKIGQSVKAGETIAVMGRTTNTHEGISKDRAHVHFELDLVINDRYAAWHKRTLPDQRNDHGDWNGQNLVGIDPWRVLVAQQREGAKFSLLRFIQNDTELCRVLVRKTSFPWLKRYRALIRQNPKAESEGVAGYEIALDFNGLPFELIPRTASEFKSKSAVQLLSVNDAEYHKNPGRRLVTPKGSRWELTSHGQNLLDLLTY
jgi:murein DD-endopeptidase MepM/ murein hydrolase activator NlpD